MESSSNYLERRNLIRQLISDKEIVNQNQLVSELAAHHVSIGQSSISRDLEALNVVKIDGRYTILDVSDGVNGSISLLNQVSSFVTALRHAGPNITVLTTVPGGAQRVAHAIDSVDWPEVVGTVAGDDTIFVATDSPTAQDILSARLRLHLSR